MRCLTLAHELRAADADVWFLTRAHDLPAADHIRESGFNVIELAPSTLRGPIADGHYSAWLGVSQQQDAEESLRAIGTDGTDLLVVDHYGLDADWESRLKTGAGSILVLDDLANRDHAAEVLLDQNLRPGGATEYDGLVPTGCRVLSGPSYALIREEYVRSRQPWSGGEPAGRIVISMGGVDDLALLAVVIRGLGSLDRQLHAIDLVVREPEHVRSRLRRDLEGLPVRLHGPRPHLADLMAQADVAIGAGGGTTWERLCVGVPSLVLSRAENQRRGVNELARLGAIVDLGDAAAMSAPALGESLAGLLESSERRHWMHEVGQALVDGLGRKRVTESLLPTPDGSLSIREATPADRGLLWMWANDRTVRKQSLDSSYIPWSTHVAWFDRVAVGADVRLLIMEADGLPVGQLRFDLRDGEAVLNYSLDAAVRGRGWGREIVELGLGWLPAKLSGTVTKVVAIVKADNRASRAIFERLGFEREETTSGGDPVYRFVRQLAA